MPGRHVNDQQARIYMRLRMDHTQATAAAKAGLSVATARRIERDPRPPSTKSASRPYRTRPDPLAGLWDEEIVALLQAAPGLRPITLLAELAQRHPGRVGASLRRTLERRVARWRALHGPEPGVGAALVMPHADTDTMSLHLAEISRTVAAGAHALVVLDGAGWHRTGGRLHVPENISLLHLPPYSPELNPVENVWAYLRQNQLSNRVFANYDAIVEACCTAWNALMSMPDRIQSIATRPWVKTVMT